MNEVYHLEEVELDSRWDEFVGNSFNGTIFSNSNFLKASGVKYKLFFCFRKNELRAGISLIEDSLSKDIILDDLVVYNGLMYNLPTNGQNLSQQMSEQFQIQKFVAEELSRKYRSIHFALHPSIIDVRAFLWMNYGIKGPKYVPEIKYTSYVDISDFKNALSLEKIKLYRDASYSRRQQIRYALKKNYETSTSNDVQNFIEFYQMTMARQSIEVETKKLERMGEIIKAMLSNGMGRLYSSCNETKEVGSMAFFAWDSKRAYYIFGANDPEKRNGHTGTSVLWDAFKDMSKLGIHTVDLEGVNSPNRGWFKLSFGGCILPYFELKKTCEIF